MYDNDLLFFFFNDSATTEIYTLSLHDALPILGSGGSSLTADFQGNRGANVDPQLREYLLDRKSTRLNSSHANISYAVFCLKKKKLIIIKNYNPINYPLHCLMLLQLAPTTPLHH